MTEHCGDCGSRLCGHGRCPQCEEPCKHCDGGDRHDKFFGYDEMGYPRTQRDYDREPRMEDEL